VCWGSANAGQLGEGLTFMRDAGTPLVALAPKYQERSSEACEGRCTGADQRCGHHQPAFGDLSYHARQAVCDPCSFGGPYPDMHLEICDIAAGAATCQQFDILAEAMQACKMSGSCGGITYQHHPRTNSCCNNDGPHAGQCGWCFELRKGQYESDLKRSPSGATSWIKSPADASDVCDCQWNPDPGNGPHCDAPGSEGCKPEATPVPAIKPFVSLGDGCGCDAYSGATANSDILCKQLGTGRRWCEAPPSAIAHYAFAGGPAPTRGV
jgi:hypothetical protein